MLIKDPVAEKNICFLMVNPAKPNPLGNGQIQSITVSIKRKKDRKEERMKGTDLVIAK